VSETSTRIVLRGACAGAGIALEPLRRFSAQAGLPAGLQHDLLVIADEIVSNWLKYGCAAAQTAEMDIQVSVEPSRLLLRFADTGPAFNPLAAAPSDPDASLEQRQAGGYGLHLVRALAGFQRYARVGDRNVLELSLPVPG